MGKQDKQIRQVLGIKPVSRKEGDKAKLKALSFLNKDWYLSSWWEKTIFVLGFIALIWKTFEIIVLGIW